MNFCVAILILKMKEEPFSAYYFIISRKLKTQMQKKKKDLCSVWRICCDWLNMSNVVYKVSWWRFLAGQWWSIDDWARSMMTELGPWSSRPVEIDSDQTETSIENNQCYTLREKDDILKISKLRVENYLHQLGYVNHFDAWISNKLSRAKQNKPKKHFLTIFYMWFST